MARLLGGYDFLFEAVVGLHGLGAFLGEAELGRGEGLGLADVGDGQCQLGLEGEALGLGEAGGVKGLQHRAKARGGDGKARAGGVGEDIEQWEERGCHGARVTGWFFAAD